MAFNQLIERHAAALKYVDSENPRRFLSRCFAKRIYGRNTAGIYVPYADEERGGDNDLRIMSSAGNYQARRGNSDWAVYDDGFNAIRARKIVRVQQFLAGDWVNMPMPMVAQRYLSRDGQDVDWSGYGWRFRDALNNELDAIFTQRQGVSKWVYRFTSAVAGRYRLVLAVDIQQPAAQVSRMNMTQIVNGVYSSLGVCRATWHWGALDSVAFDWSDMIRTGVYASHVIGPNGAAVTTRAVNMTAGQTVEIDPILTQDAGFTGGGASADSDWGIDSAYGNTVATGAVGGNELRSVYRFDISSFASGDTINDVDLNTYVSDQSGVNYNSGIIGPYNGNGTGDPDTDAYATAWSRAGVSADNYINGNTFIRTDGAVSFDLGAAADVDMATARAAGSTFSLAKNITTPSGNSYWFTPAHTNTTPANIPELVVDTTASGGGGSTNNGFRSLLGVGR